MFQKLKLVAILFAIFSVSSASACAFINIPINPISPEKIDTFLGSSENIEIRFDNEKLDGSIEVFPDSSLNVTNKRENTSCSVEGGVWVRKDVYVSDDNGTVLAHEFSGSNDFLNFYDTRRCGKIGSIDISNSTWKLEKLNVYVFRKNAKGKNIKKPRIYPLAKYCTKTN